MKPQLRRRDFFKTCAHGCIAFCALMATPKMFSLNNELPFLMEEKPDPKSLNFCGYTCPPDCPFKKATIEDDLDLKKESWKNWKLKERYGLEFDENTAYCYGCKDKEHSPGAVMSNCTVRKCTIEKGLDCCIECAELPSCDKDLWTRFPEFYDGVKKLREQYLTG